MATYVELYALRTDTTLLQRLSVAVLVSANVVRLEAANTAQHSNRLAWAQQAIRDPDAPAQKVLGLLLAANKDSTVAQINAASDATLQTLVDALVNTLTGQN
jgi:hypothetical protein